jgi:uncharacterized glyoxalase superfamily protein PhnB
MASDEQFKGNHFKKAVPSLPVKNCSDAIRYYRDVLGFKKDFDDEILGFGETLFAGVSRGECALTLNQHEQQDYRMTVGIEIDDVDLLHEELRAKQAKILFAPRDEVWGARHMAVEDLYGHELHFSSPMRSKS